MKGTKSRKAQKSGVDGDNMGAFFADGTSIGSKFLKQPRVPTSTTEKTATTEEEEEEEEDTPTTTTPVKTSKKSSTAVGGASSVVNGCTKGSALRHTDGNILICGFSAGDFACPPTHSCTFDTTRGKFVCCLRGTSVHLFAKRRI